MTKYYYIWNEELSQYIRAYRADIKFLENLGLIENCTAIETKLSQFYKAKKVKNP